MVRSSCVIIVFAVICCHVCSSGPIDIDLETLEGSGENSPSTRPTTKSVPILNGEGEIGSGEDSVTVSEYVTKKETDDDNLDGKKGQVTTTPSNAEDDVSSAIIALIVVAVFTFIIAAILTIGVIIKKKRKNREGNEQSVTTVSAKKIHFVPPEKYMSNDAEKESKT